MGYAIISDIHSNLEAFQAVLWDIYSYNSTTFSINHIVCLGDIVGYGPNPVECIDMVIDNYMELAHDNFDIIKFKMVLMGNHDYAVIDERLANLFNPRARSVIDWTRNQLMKDKEKNGKRINFLKNLKPKYGENNYLYVHGSPADPLGYVCSEAKKYKDIALWAIDPKVADRSFHAMQDKDVCFTGHTHYPSVLDENFNFHHAHLEPIVKLKKKGKAIIGVGSVGQPRDGGDKACYVFFDPKSMVIQFRWVKYDYKITQNKIMQIQEIPLAYRQRLAGRLQGNK